MANESLFLLQLQINQQPLSFEHDAGLTEYEQIYAKETIALEAAKDWVRRAAYPLVKDITGSIEDKTSYLYDVENLGSAAIKSYRQTCKSIFQNYNDLEAVSNIQDLNKIISNFFHLLDDEDFVAVFFEGFLDDKPYGYFRHECTAHQGWEPEYSYYFFVLKVIEPEQFFSSFLLSEPYDTPIVVKPPTFDKK